VKLDDYRLDTAAQVILGRGSSSAEHRATIETAWAWEDPGRPPRITRNDARLVEILERTGLVELTVRRSLLTGMQIDRVGAQIAAVDSLYLSELRARGHVAPSVHIEDAQGTVIAGGLVLDSVPGLYRNILVFDFKSLYPSLIRTFNIDPLTHVVPAHETPGQPLVRTPSGAAFRVDVPGILPDLVARLWEERAHARRQGDAVGAQATKILMNSLFGVLGASACRLFSPAVANAITIAGQHVIRLAAAAVEQAGHRVIYGDTDSLFVDAGESDPDSATRRAESLRETIGTHVAEALRAEFGVRSWLELEFEKVYARFWMPEVRGGATGSKKRYAGLVAGPGEETLELVGLEAVRRDWSAVARRFQKELLHLVFHDRPVEDFIRGFVANLRAGRFDAELAYRKAIRSPRLVHEDHAAPREGSAEADGRSGRIVTYIVTTAGPEAAGRGNRPARLRALRHAALRPIADALLHFVGAADFDTIAGIQRPRRQLALFAEGSCHDHAAHPDPRRACHRVRRAEPPPPPGRRGRARGRPDRPRGSPRGLPGASRRDRRSPGPGAHPGPDLDPRPHRGLPAGPVVHRGHRPAPVLLLRPLRDAAGA
jgi:DNA polymerase-2